MTQTPQKVGRIMLGISRRMGKAISDYDMIRDGDKIIVAVSGGMASQTLLHLLRYRQTFAPIDFDLLAVYVDCRQPDFPVMKLADTVAKEAVPFRAEPADSLEIKEGEEGNSFWCINDRRQTLFRLANDLGFNKIALGHHLDDIVETILRNLLYRGELGAMRPRQDLFEGQLSIIRPLAYEDKKKIQNFVREEMSASFVMNPVTRSENTEDQSPIKKLMAELEKKDPRIKRNIFHALQNIKSDYLLNS